MKSIKNKLFLQIGILVVILIVLFMAGYSLLFDSIYMVVAKNRLLNHYNYINELDRVEYNTIENEIDKNSRGFYLDVFIHNSQGNLLYESKKYLIDSSKLKELDIIPKYLDDIPSFLEIYNEEEINGKVSFIWAHDYLLDTDTLNILGVLDNGDHIVLRVRLVPSEISIVATNRFAPIVGILLLSIGMLFAYILSTKFAQPLVTMNKATTEISNLNFETTCKVESKDELGQLANKINILSKKLKATIDDLSKRNDELNSEIDARIRIDENRKQLLNNVSHELKTPLTLMQSYADGLKLNVANSPDKADYYCDVIIDETDKMNDLINKLLDINRITFGDITPVNIEFELIDFMHELINRYKDRMQKEHIKFTFCEKKPIIVYTDKKNLETVLNNLIDNAIKYVDSDKSISINVINNDSAVRIEVYNSASHITQDNLKKVWDSFYKIDESRNRNINGHGLGLSIIKAIQEAAQMSYGAQNADKGVLFWIEVMPKITEKSNGSTELNFNEATEGYPKS